MDRLRNDLIRRTRLERHGQDEEAAIGPSETSDHAQQATSNSSCGIFASALKLPRYFTSRHRDEVATNGDEQSHTPIKPPQDGAPSSTEPVTQEASNIGRSGPDSDFGEYSMMESTRPASSRYSVTPHQPYDFPMTRPSMETRSTVLIPSPAHIHIDSFTPDPSNAHLATLVDDSRRRSRRKQRKRSHKTSTRSSATPTRFLFCFPWVKSRRIRSLILQTFVSGVMMISLLAVYLGLSLSKNIQNQQLGVMLIVIIVVAFAVFGFSLLRLSMVLIYGDRSNNRPAKVSIGPSGYAISNRPIPVAMAQDEFDAQSQTKWNIYTPPAYGEWRKSVRVDPDRFYWQRSEVSTQPEMPTADSRAPRPPSYVSEDGVSYVVDATERSTVAHSSEARVTQPRVARIPMMNHGPVHFWA